MEGEALFWLTLNALSIAILAFYSMEEMAFVSFNRVRLQYYVAEGSQRAYWINTLLQNPSTLFGTTLIGVNVATFVGSECARQFHSALGLSPDLAPLSQVILVIIFGELAPMFAARRYSEHVALLGAPVIFASSILLSPFIWFFGWISKAANKIFGGHESTANLFLTQDELQKILEEQDDERTGAEETNEFNAITSNIFRLKEMGADQVMTALSFENAVSDQMTVWQLRNSLVLQNKYMIVYRNTIDHVTGIVYIKDLLSATEGKKLFVYCKPAWFISSSTPLITILKQFRQNSERIAIVLNPQGKSVGYIAFEDILDEIFGETGSPLPALQKLIHRTFEGEITLGKLKKEGIILDGSPEETLSSWLIRAFEHPPEAGETYSLPPYSFTVKETSLLGITSVEVKSLY